MNSPASNPAPARNPAPAKGKVPWLPHEVQPGQATEVCPQCGARKLMPWTLRRDPKRVTLLRTWVCANCQHTEERDEPES